MKKSLLILFAIIFAISLNTQAEDFSAVYNGDTIYYKIKSSTSPRKVEVTYRGSSITSYSNEYSGAVSIPDSVLYNGYYYKVTSIGSSAFYQCSELTSIAIPNTVTSIGFMAFKESGLTSVVIPNSVTVLSSQAFYYCSELLIASIGDSVNAISNETFLGCGKLTTISIPNSVTSIGNFAFRECINLSSVSIGSSVTNIGEQAFFACINLSSISFPNSLTSIGESAFNVCNRLTSVEIPNSVTSIGDCAFCNCIGLTSVTLSNSLTSISWGAFANCISLTSITIPNSVTSINGSFQGCSGLTSITIPNSVTSIGGSAFDGCTGLTSITIPNSVTSIDQRAFQNCTGLTTITLPNSVTYIGQYTFQNCSGLTSVTLSNMITSIYEYTFEYCSELTSITIPNSVTSIGNYAFRGCTELSSITIPNSVTSVGDGVFANCNQLDSIFCDVVTPPNIQSNTFLGVNRSIPLKVPCASIPTYQSSPYWSEFTNYIIIKTAQYIADTICSNQTYTNYGANINTAGNYLLVDDCDSVFLTLVVKPIYSIELYDTIRQGLHYSRNGLDFIPDISREYVFTYQSNNGCDSIIVLNLEVLGPRKLYVSTNGNDNLGNGTELNPYRNIQYAVNQSINQDTIIILPGTYYENITIDKEIVLASKFVIDSQLYYIDSTILDGGNQNSVKLINSNNNIITVKGLTIQNGYAVDGGAISILNNTNYKLENLKIINNRGVNAGGVHCSYGVGEIVNCIFLNNFSSSVGGAIIAKGNLRISGCEFINNSCNDQGGAIFIDCGFDLKISSSVFTMNKAVYNSAISNWCGGRLYINSSLFYNNYSPNGALIGHYSSIDTIINSTFVNNNTYNISLIDNSSVLYMNSIFHSATTLNFSVNASIFKIKNSIHNLGRENINNTDNYIQSIIQWDTLTNIVANPEFADTSLHDFSLLPNSPAIGAGIITNSIQDLFGNLSPNPIGSFPDLGAIESPLALPQTQVASISDLCLNSYPIVLNNVKPSGGVYSGNGITNDSIFNPSIAGVGEHKIVYTYTNLNSQIIKDSFNIIVNPTYSISFNDTICQGQSYNNYGFNFIADTSGLYTQNLQTTKGCDSIINLYLIVNPIYNYTIQAEICSNEIYTLN
ncbi:MAG: leucine-rich repeat protein, partial [Bacteroidales bacterium]|nr:leucine-rich repeat protein [Bacteroidales bacterium]